MNLKNNPSEFIGKFEFDYHATSHRKISNQVKRYSSHRESCEISRRITVIFSRQQQGRWYWRVSGGIAPQILADTLNLFQFYQGGADIATRPLTDFQPFLRP